MSEHKRKTSSSSFSFLPLIDESNAIIVDEKNLLTTSGNDDGGGSGMGTVVMSPLAMSPTPFDSKKVMEEEQPTAVKGSKSVDSSLMIVPPNTPAMNPVVVKLNQQEMVDFSSGEFLEQQLPDDGDDLNLDDAMIKVKESITHAHQQMQQQSEQNSLPPLNANNLRRHRSGSSTPVSISNVKSSSSVNSVGGVTSSRIRLGICAMDKKARSKPMSEILSRLDNGQFHVVFFGEDVIFNKDVEEWPKVDVLIAFYSGGYPLSKVEDYVSKNEPFVLNDLSMQHTLLDRRKVYDLMEEHGIRIPRHVYVSRDGYVSKFSGAGIKVEELEEFDDSICVNGVTINKPFVEKPVDADDHRIRIYYPQSAGGGCKFLFRKIGDRSSEFYPDVNEIRRDGSYIYEEFVETQGVDVKMYTVGPDYGHAEARKVSISFLKE